MEKSSVKTLQIKGMEQVVAEAATYIKDRKSGKEKSLRVNSPKVNSTFMAGFDWGRITTIGGLSGSGKSTLLRQWIKEMIENNTTENFDVLTFQFEMLSTDEAARDISSKMKKSIKQLYSADGKLNDADYEKAMKLLEELKKYPIFVVDNLGTVSEIKDTILYYISSNKLIEKKRGLVITLDHTLLVRGEDNENEKQTLDRLMHTLVLLKKYLTSIGLKVMFFILSQLNREIESPERITNPKLHYPTKNDLFGASSIYYSSDYVIIMHQPAIIDGIGNWYGPTRTGFPQGLPCFCPQNPKQPMIYLHVIKERFGNRLIIPMLNELDSATITEYSF